PKVASISAQPMRSACMLRSDGRTSMTFMRPCSGHWVSIIWVLLTCITAVRNGPQLSPEKSSREFSPNPGENRDAEWRSRKKTLHIEEVSDARLVAFSRSPLYGRCVRANARYGRCLWQHFRYAR